MPEEVVSDGASQVHNVNLSEPSQEPSSPKPSSESFDEGQGKDTSSEQGNGQQHKPKGESRYERTKRERAEFRAQQEAFHRERQAFANERAQFEESKKPKRDYSLADLKKYRAQWARQAARGDYSENSDPADLVEKADKEIAAMEAEEQAERAARTVEMPRPGSPEHTAQWQQAERELYDADAEFMRAGTRLDKQLRAIMASADGDIYRSHPRGIVAAYHRAKMELLEADMKSLSTENSKFKAELQRLTGLTSIDGGSLGQVGNGSGIESVNDFARLSSKDMRKHLMRTAQRGSTPWF